MMASWFSVSWSYVSVYVFVPYVAADRSATVATAAAPSARGLRGDGQRLEFVGDSALDLLVTDHYFRAEVGSRPLIPLLAHLAHLELLS
jgi:hypothetical protein